MALFYKLRHQVSPQSTLHQPNQSKLFDSIIWFGLMEAYINATVTAAVEDAGRDDASVTEA